MVFTLGSDQLKNNVIFYDRLLLIFNILII
jgi:hypothetical protein